MRTQAHSFKEVMIPRPSKVMRPSPHAPLQNHLFAALSPVAQDRLLPYMELVELKQGQVLQEHGDKWRYAYFPTTSIISKICQLESCATAEIAAVGNEGMVSICLFMSDESIQNQTLVKSSGYAYRIKGQLVRDEFDRCADSQNLFLRYTQALMMQISQTAVCNRHHSVNQQLCRWLLLNLDRLKTNELVMTHELIAYMLGVRREGITEAAGNLQSAGLIKYCRGHIHILDREGLEDRSCECYEVVKHEFERLLPDLSKAWTESVRLYAQSSKHFASEAVT